MVKMLNWWPGCKQTGKCSQKFDFSVISANGMSMHNLVGTNIPELYNYFTEIVHFSVFESKQHKKLKSNCSHQLLHAFILLNFLCFESFEHFSKGILEKMIPHWKASISSYKNQELDWGCILGGLCNTMNTNRRSLWPTLYVTAL